MSRESDRSPSTERVGGAPPPCPACGARGKRVSEVTISSLVREEELGRLERTDGFRFCATPGCDVAYYHPETGVVLPRAAVRARIGVKETEPPRPICYCFGHTVEEIEEEVRRTGTSRVPDEITEKCRQGLDRCEQTNPQGSCCLGNVRRAVREAQAARGGSASPRGTAAPARFTARIGAGGAQLAAVGLAVLASACCWLPLLLIAVGVSGSALAARLEAWRPIFVPLALAALAAAFYLAYRRPVAGGVGGGDDTADDCCAGASASEGSCSLPAGATRRRWSPRRAQRIALWAVTPVVVALAFAPSWIDAVLPGGDANALEARADLEPIHLTIEGMTCEACAASIEDRLRQVRGVSAASVDAETGTATVGVVPDAGVAPSELLRAVSSAGPYRARVAGDGTDAGEDARSR